MTQDFSSVFGNIFNTKYGSKNCTSCPYLLLPNKIKNIKSKMIDIKKLALKADTKEKYNQIIIDGFATIYKLL